MQKIMTELLLVR